MSQNKLYVSNLPYTMNDNDLYDLFAQFGEIVDHVIIMDRASNRSKGFGFVTFTSDDQAQAALSLNGTEHDGRKLNVNIARDAEKRGGGGGGSRQRENNYYSD